MRRFNGLSLWIQKVSLELAMRTAPLKSPCYSLEETLDARLSLLGGLGMFAGSIGDSDSLVSAWLTEEARFL